MNRKYPNRHPSWNFDTEMKQETWDSWKLRPNAWQLTLLRTRLDKGEISGAEWRTREIPFFLLPKISSRSRSRAAKNTKNPVYLYLIKVCQKIQPETCVYKLHHRAQFTSSTQTLLLRNPTKSKNPFCSKKILILTLSFPSPLIWTNRTNITPNTKSTKNKEPIRQRIQPKMQSCRQLSPRS